MEWSVHNVVDASAGERGYKIRGHTNAAIKAQDPTSLPPRQRPSTRGMCKQVDCARTSQSIANRQKVMIMG